MSSSDAKAIPPTLTLRLFGYSAVGIFMFFVPLPLGERTTIPLDHIITAIRTHLPMFSRWYAFAMVVAGAGYPFLTGQWRKDTTSIILSVFKALGVLAAGMYVFSLGPQFLLAKDLLPFLFEKLVIPVGLIVPIGAIFLAFLVDYGLLELVGVLMQPIMRPVWKTPGRSAVDALASFVGSYSIGLLITNRVFTEGKYTVKEAAIIATGFSTVSATFMVIVAKTCGLMPMWNTYFWSTLLVTFGVTAITVRIPPLSRKSDIRVGKASPMEEAASGSRLHRALEAGLNTLAAAPPIRVTVAENLRDGFRMAAGILPTIMSVGLLGLLVARYTPVFDITSYLFWPLVKLLGMPEAGLISRAVSVGITEMFLPALMVREAEFTARFVVAIVSVSSILFFSASIPCILATDIPLTVGEMLLIWIERTALSILLAGSLIVLVL